MGVFLTLYLMNKVVSLASPGEVQAHVTLTGLGSALGITGGFWHTWPLPSDCLSPQIQALLLSMVSCSGHVHTLTLMWTLSIPTIQTPVLGGRQARDQPQGFLSLQSLGCVRKAALREVVELPNQKG